MWAWGAARGRGAARGPLSRWAIRARSGAARGLFPMAHSREAGVARGLLLNADSREAGELRGALLLNADSREAGELRGASFRMPIRARPGSCARSICLSGHCLRADNRTRGLASAHCPLKGANCGTVSGVVAPNTFAPNARRERQTGVRLWIVSPQTMSGETYTPRTTPRLTAKCHLVFTMRWA